MKSLIVRSLLGMAIPIVIVIVLAMLAQAVISSH